MRLYGWIMLPLSVAQALAAQSLLTPADPHVWTAVFLWGSALFTAAAVDGRLAGSK